MLETKRLLLRPITINDFSLFYQLHNEPQVIKYCFDPYSECDVKNRIAECWDGTGAILNQRVVFVVRVKLLNRDVGVNEFFHIDNKIEVGFLFLPEYFGKGYGYESLKCIIEFAKSQGIQTLNATVTKGNQGSVNLLLKAGFQCIGEKENAYNIGGKLVDDIYFKRELETKNAV
jgi:RimJ/RimL family protein N-acetyltransferase